MLQVEMKQYVISCENLECECLFAMLSSQKSLIGIRCSDIGGAVVRFVQLPTSSRSLLL